MHNGNAMILFVNHSVGPSMSFKGGAESSLEVQPVIWVAMIEMKLPYVIFGLKIRHGNN